MNSFLSRMIVSKDMPMYDQRFSGYGGTNRLIYTNYTLVGITYCFTEAFVIHIEHGVPHWRNTANKTRIWVNWYAFALQKEEQFRDVGAKAYFSGSWQKKLTKAELPPEVRASSSVFRYDMEVAGKLDCVHWKERRGIKKFWIENISHKTEALRSLVRELVNRFHNNVEPLRQALFPNQST